MAKDKPAPTTLREWRLERSGGGMTAYGTNIDTNEQDRITNISVVVPPDNPVLHEVHAHDKHGTVHRLIFA